MLSAGYKPACYLSIIRLALLRFTGSGGHKALSMLGGPAFAIPNSAPTFDLLRWAIRLSMSLLLMPISYTNVYTDNSDKCHILDAKKDG